MFLFSNILKYIFHLRPLPDVYHPLFRHWMLCHRIIFSFNENKEFVLDITQYGVSVNGKNATGKYKRNGYWNITMKLWRKLQKMFTLVISIEGNFLSNCSFWNSSIWILTLLWITWIPRIFHILFVIVSFVIQKQWRIP